MKSTTILLTCLVVSICVGTLSTIRHNILEEENKKLTRKYNLIVNHLEREECFEFEAHLPDGMGLSVRVDYQDDYPMDDLKMRVIRKSIVDAIGDKANFELIEKIRQDARGVFDSIENSREK